MSARTINRIFAAGVGLALVVVGGQASFSGTISSSAIYTVRPGDSLWEIASIDGLTVDQLAGANGLSPDAWLQPGQVLAIPPASYTPDATLTASVTVDPSATSSSSSASASNDSVSSTTPSAGSSTAGFCYTFVSSGGPQGELPALLAQSPDRLALRPLFVQFAYQYGVSPALVEAIAWQESGWQEGVVSVDGAVGIGQLIPSTAAFIDQDLIGANLDDTQAAQNIEMSAAFLGYLNRVEEGNLCNVIAAYYEGPVNLEADGVFAITEPYVESVEALIPRFE